MDRTPYQTRMTKFVVAGSIYAVGFPAAIKYFAAPKEYYFMYFSTLVVLYCLAAGLDAVYDSLKERSDTLWSKGTINS